MNKHPSRLQHLDAVNRFYSGPIPNRELAIVEAGSRSKAELNKTIADLKFWKNYIRSGIRAYRAAATPKRREQVRADIRSAWPKYRAAYTAKSAVQRSTI